MSTQGFSAEFRKCIWQLHSEKCYYCKNPLQITDLEIDHLLPETLLSDETELKLVLNKYSLSSTFNIMGNENLIASCNGCNGDKSDNQLEIGYISIALAYIRKRLDKLKICINKKKKDRLLASILINITSSIEKNIFTEQEFIIGLNKEGFLEGIKSKGNLLFDEKNIYRDSNSDSNDKILWKKSAVREMTKHNIDSNKLLLLLNNKVNVQRISHDNKKGYFKLRINNRIRMVYTVTNDGIKIVEFTTSG